MDEELKFYLEETKDAMQKAIDHLYKELSKIRAGKANPSMVEGVKVDYYGSETPLNQVANVSTPDAKTIMIQPWEKTMIDPISKAIMDANLGFNPSNDGNVIHINVPALTEERRRDLVKKAKAEGESCKVSIRTIRKDTNDTIKQLQKDGLSEDMSKTGEGEVQKMTDAFSAKTDEAINQKEKDIMTV